MLLVTGGAGFIGSNFVLSWLAGSEEPIVTLDKLSYAGNLRNLEALRGDARHIFIRGDIADRPLLKQALERHRPRAIVHFAAESHVDRSILGPADFIETNIVGTWSLLEEARAWWGALPAGERDAFRFLHVSTDEVYGSLGPQDRPFSESTPYAPNSPYAASKAAADHLVRAYRHTYGLPTLTGNCSNNYGPYQFPEKLIPLMIRNALAGEPLPVYGDGRQVRDWLYVLDHCDAIRCILEKGSVGQTYNIGGNSEKENIEVVRAVCAILDSERPRSSGSYARQISFVKDRPGHDRRYAIDGAKLRAELGWAPAETFETGLAKTVRWYLEHPAWVEEVTSGAYRTWVDTNYARRGAA
jgi:dTDP-glucose 4,6-dehydratase